MCARPPILSRDSSTVTYEQEENHGMNAVLHIVYYYAKECCSGTATCCRTLVCTLRWCSWRICGGNSCLLDQVTYSWLH